MNSTLWKSAKEFDDACKAEYQAGFEAGLKAAADLLSAKATKLRNRYGGNLTEVAQIADREAENLEGLAAQVRAIHTPVDR